MRGSHKWRRVSWASDENLCQVRLFLAEDNPSQVGLGGQDHLQAKASWILHSSGANTDDSLPPGFENTSPADQLKNKSPQVPLTHWRCPPKFVLNISWRVVAGEESRELQVQNHREMRVLEAIYPRPCAIPLNPAVAMDMEDGHPSDDSDTILIPMNPIEEDDATADRIADLKVPMSQALGSTAESQCKQGTLIDPDLLMKILSNPDLFGRLAAEHGLATDRGAVQTNGMEAAAAAPSAAGPADGAFVNDTPPGFPAPLAPSSGAKGIGYYQNLIQQHGEERNHSKMEVKMKGNKPCIYFNSPRGCRKGSRCAYVHDGGMQEDVQSGKRMKMGRDMAGKQSCS